MYDGIMRTSRINDQAPGIDLNFSQIRIFLISLGLFFLTSCDQPGEQRAEFIVFGTVMEVTTWGASEAQAQTAFSELQSLFQLMHRDWHTWEPGRLTGINQAFAEGRSAQADEDILELIIRSQQLEKLSGGRFNPAIGGLVRLWGFHTSDFPVLGPPPDPLEIQSLLDLAPSTLNIQIRGLEVESTNSSVLLDFGGIAKGYAIDLACTRLRELGIRNAIVNAGGDLRAFGRHGSRAWRVGIRNPTGGIIGGVSAGDDEAIFTSGVYERFRQDQQERYPHILDPRTGWPVEGIAAVTVISDEGLLADAAATAIIVAGQEDWVSVARSLGLDKILLVDESGTVYLTEEMNRRVELVEGVERVIIDMTDEH
jgi:thiamine biosynthesis lipoprotein